MSNMAAELGSSGRASSERSSKRRQGGDSMESPMRGLSPARTREPAAGPTAGPTIADSPKRFSVDGSRIEAASPVAPTQDMTITEVTHVYQHSLHWISNGRDELSWQSLIMHCGLTAISLLATMLQHVFIPWRQIWRATQVRRTRLAQR